MLLLARGPGWLRLHAVAPRLLEVTLTAKTCIHNGTYECKYLHTYATRSWGGIPVSVGRGRREEEGGRSVSGLIPTALSADSPRGAIGPPHQSGPILDLIAAAPLPRQDWEGGEGAAAASRDFPPSTPPVTTDWLLVPTLFSATVHLCLTLFLCLPVSLSFCPFSFFFFFAFHSTMTPLLNLPK